MATGIRCGSVFAPEPVGCFRAFFTELTGGERNDAPLFETLLSLGRVKPRAVVGDKGYDSKANRQAARQSGILPVIPYRDCPYRDCHKEKPDIFGKKLYRGRAASSRPSASSNASSALPFDARNKRTFASFVAFAAACILAKAVTRPSWESHGR